MDRHRPRRPGFTLIEVLTAILIIGILIAILVPTLASAFRHAKEAQVAAEMNNIATALESFKTKYGEYPPSRLYCSESGYYPANNALAQRSMLYLQRFFPRMALSTTGPAVPSTAGRFYDFNNDGNDDSTSSANRSGFYILEGPECLVFFLGGMPTRVQSSSGTTQFGLAGFDKNPLNPFRTFVQAGAGSTAANRSVSLYEFATGRLDGSSNAQEMPSYLDPLGSAASGALIGNSDKRPYAYFCAYGTNAYDPNDYNCTYEVDDNNAVLGRTFNVAFPPGSVSSPAPNPYTSSLPAPAGNNAPTATFFNANSFQLICAGQDRQWGIGGEYNKASTGNILPLTDPANVTPNPLTETNPRLRERDNITNFAGGRLD
ncbi:type II secretion system protein [Tundrisphaera lichenicola]|uniref:type II secretion system protein n=1 Tax=Tundrisphaera lichenicola TaxID=2029860 RepID=UPI003EB73371